MPTLDEALAHANRRGRCSYAALRDGLPADARATLERAVAGTMRDGTPVSASAVAAAIFEAHGVRMSEDIVTKHRRGQCVTCNRWAEEAA